MFREVTAVHHEVDWVIWEWTCINGAGDVLTDRCIFRLTVGNVNWRAIADEAEELRCDVLMHTDTTVGAGGMLDPSCVKTVGGLKFTPVWHWSAFKAPASWFSTEFALLDNAAIGGVTVCVCSAFCLFTVNCE